MSLSYPTAQRMLGIHKWAFALGLEGWCQWCKLMGVGAAKEVEVGVERLKPLKRVSTLDFKGYWRWIMGGGDYWGHWGRDWQVTERWSACCVSDCETNKTNPKITLSKLASSIDRQYACASTICISDPLCEECHWGDLSKYNTIQTLLYNQDMHNQLLSKLASKSNC